MVTIKNPGSKENILLHVIKNKYNCRTLRHLKTKYKLVNTFELTMNEFPLNYKISFFENDKKTNQAPAQCEKTNEKNIHLLNCCDFNSQIAYIVKRVGDDIMEEVTIQDYLNDKKLINDVRTGKKFLVCANNQMLIKYESEKRQSHFKHKNNYYNGMLEWHKNWQNNFEDTEVRIGTRSADAYVHNTAIEFQHSRIPKEIINKRKDNYLKCNKQLCWVIDCNECVDIDELSLHKTFLIKFKQDYWKYQNFVDNDYIYLDVLGKIFRIKPNEVKSHMIDVKEYKTKESFIESLKSNQNVWDDSVLPQCKLYYNQLGAGCGKTYDSIQLLNRSEEFKHKTSFVYLTMQHSAKEVIYKELSDQYKEGKLTKIEIDESNIDDDGDIGIQRGKQYIITYTNKDTNKDCKITIGTMHSFMFALGDKSVKGNDYFYEIVKSVRDNNGNINKGNKRYAGDTLKLNKESLIVIDEAQDLEPIYIQAMCKIMRDTYIDVYVIGDKLQSIWDEVNIFTYLENNELPNTLIIKYPGINHVRRFHNNKLKEFVNNTIKFEEHKLPPIEKICDEYNCKYNHENTNCVQIFCTPPSRQNNENGDKILDATINTMIEYMNNEVEKYNYVPSDFMFIFPILKKIPMANMLEARIQKYWIDKFSDDEYRDTVLTSNGEWKDKINDKSYCRYVYLHKSDEGKSINLKESENATRILSIHASKGSGRNVVFLCDPSEDSLKKFSNKTGNLQYESLLHVALTRQKKSLYIALQFNNDDIFARVCGTKNRPIIKISEENVMTDLRFIRNTIKYEKIIDYARLDDDNFLKIIHNHTIYDNDDKKNKDVDKKTIDWGHHLIRYCVFDYYIMYYIINNEKVDSGDDQIKTIIKKISTYSPELFHYEDYYKRVRGKSWEAHKIFPILLQDTIAFSIYQKYSHIVSDFIKKIQTKIINSLNHKKLPKLCPMEATILMHIIHTVVDTKYSDITIMDVFSVMHCYNECSSALDEKHNEYDCLCKINFKSDYNQDSLKYKEFRENIMNHYEKINQIESLYKNYVVERLKYCGKDIDFTYNIQHNIHLNLKGKQFDIYNKYKFLAHSPNYVIHFIVKPQYTPLNKYEIVFDALFNNFILASAGKDTKNYERYNGKKIITCVLTLDSEKPYFHIFDVNKEVIRETIKNYMLEEYEKYSEYIYYYFSHCCKNNTSEKSDIECVYGEINNFEKLPDYVRDFFRDKYKKYDKNKKKNNRVKMLKIVTALGDKDTFVKDLNDYLKSSVYEYLDIHDEINDNIIEPEKLNFEEMEISNNTISFQPMKFIDRIKNDVPNSKTVEVLKKDSDSTANDFQRISVNEDYIPTKNLYCKTNKNVIAKERKYKVIRTLQK